MGNILINKDLIQSVCDKASTVSRKRMNHNFHSEYNDPINRMLNALQMGTYCRPHKHEALAKREVFIILQGRVAVFIFDDNGNIDDCIILDEKGDCKGIEIEPKAWHAIICIEPNSVVYELKDGPYVPLDDKSFASWAPKEDSHEAVAYLSKLEKHAQQYL